jgi:RNA polymerase sigma-70 factor (ECF subfamily)
MVPARLRPITLMRAVTSPHELPPRAGEAAALLERLFAEYQTSILNYLYRLVGEAGLAEDLAQETFTRAWRASAQLMAVDNPRAWLYRIATNAARDDLRRRRLIAWLPLMSSDERLSDSGFEDRSLVGEQMRRALLRLKPEYRIPLVLYTCQDFSVAEIAIALAISTDAVKQRLVRARQQLRDAIE